MGSTRRTIVSVASCIAALWATAAQAQAQSQSGSADQAGAVKPTQPPAPPSTAPQGAPDTGQTGGGNGGGLGDIVVTAQRQQQNLQRAPLSITAFTGDALRDRGITSVENLAQQTPSLNVKTDFGAANPNIYIRGVGIGDFNANVTGAVGVYVDEVYQSAPAGQLFQFYDVERVEVLRGPQGTLYGRNTTGGAINIISRAPTEDLTANATALYGRFNEVQLEGGIGGALVPDTIRVRVSGTYHSRDGFIRNTYTGPSLAPRRVADIDTWAARGQIEFRPASNLQFLLNGHFGSSTTSGVQFKHRGLLDPAAFAKGQIVPCSVAQLKTYSCVDALGYRDPSTSPDTVQYNGALRERVRAWGTNLRAKLDLGGYSLISITAYENVRRYSVFDGDESPNSLLDAVHNPRSREFTQELRLASPTTGRFRWTLGGYYFDEKLRFDGSFDLFRSVRPGIAAAAQGLGLGPPLSLGFNPTGGPALAAQLGNPVFAYPTFFATYGYDQRVRSYAAFGQAYFSLTDKLTATGGLRYSDEKRRFEYLSAFSEPFVTIPLAQTSRALGNDRVAFDDVSWRAALEWQATPEVFAFGSVSRGAKSGGYNGAFLTSQAQTTPFGDEKLTSYELGVKTESFGRKLRFNVTGFYYDYRDLQVYTLQSTGGIPQLVLSNAPKARVYGAEFEVLARPVQPLVVSLGASLLSSRIVSDFIGGNGVNQRGNQLGYAPHFTASGSATWTQPLAGDRGAVVAAADFSYQGRAYTDTRNLERLRTDAAVLVGTRLAYQLPGNRVELGLFGRNVFNRRYIAYVADLGDFGFDRVRYNEPATYGVNAKVNF